MGPPSKHRRLLAATLLVGVCLHVPLQCFPTTYAYVFPRKGESSSSNGNRRDQRMKAIRQHGEILLPSPTSAATTSPELSVEESNFWRSVPKRQRRREEDVLPVDSYLDVDGPLPFGAYRTFGNPNHDPSRTCLLSVALDFTAEDGRRRIKNGKGRKNKRSVVDQLVEGINVDAAIRNIHGLIDAGFTTFQVAADPTQATSVELQGWADECVFCSLRKETPSSVLRNCNFVTKIPVPPKDIAAPFGSGASIREAVGASLRRTGADCIDTVQFPYCKDSPYHLDVLDVLVDMQQQGFIRSISGLGLPTSIVTEAEECNFHLDSNQIQCNLFDPQTYVNAVPVHSENNIKMICGSPLAGGLFTDKYLQCGERRPTPHLLSASETRNAKDMLPVWARRRFVDGSRNEHWQQYNQVLMKTLGEIAYKHQESVAAVALRWSFHLDNLGSVVVASRVGSIDEDERPFNRPRELRKVFRFEIDEEDIQRLWDVTGCSRNPKDDAEGYGGINDFFPDLNNRKLWL